VAGRRRDSRKGKLRIFGADRSGKKAASRTAQDKIAQQRATGKNKDTDRSGRKPKSDPRGDNRK
jgi:hypothetical protein